MSTSPIRVSSEEDQLLRSEHSSSPEVESFQVENGLFGPEVGNNVYIAKSKVLSEAIDKVGFGRYQWGLFLVAGFGWSADNFWPVVTSLVLSRLNEVDGVHSPPQLAPLLILSQNIGLLIGAAFWSLSSDIIGRRWAFNFTFLITGIFGVAAGASPNFATICLFCGLWSFGVGGNLPVDSAIFLEALPSTHQWILTVMSSWWSFGQILANVLSWALISNFSCDSTDKTCYKKDNKGWRYFLYAMGGLTLAMFVLRFSFSVFESPKFYLARGEDKKALESLASIARINGTEVPISIEDLQRVDRLYYVDTENDENSPYINKNQLIKEKLQAFDGSHIRECFASRKLAISSTLVISTWGLVGLAFPLYNAFLPYFLETRFDAGQKLSVQETYRNSLFIALLGIPGAAAAGFLVELRIGRKGTLFGSLILTGLFLFASTTAKTPNSYLFWNCGFSFFSNIMYGVLYAYTPEVFYTKIRGTGVGLASSFNRVFGIFAPIIAIYADLTTSTPIFISGALFIFSGILTLFFPFEPRGRSSL